MTVSQIYNDLKRPDVMVIGRLALIMLNQLDSVFVNQYCFSFDIQKFQGIASAAFVMLAL